VSMVEAIRARFFRDEDAVADDATYAVAREAVDWVSQPYHEKFCKWLDDEASKPFQIGQDQMALIQAAVRANTLREVRRHVERVRVAAMATLERIREESNG
jgi:hypothetical protein